MAVVKSSFNTPPPFSKGGAPSVNMSKGQANTRGSFFNALVNFMTRRTENRFEKKMTVRKQDGRIRTHQQTKPPKVNNLFFN